MNKAIILLLFILILVIDMLYYSLTANSFRNVQYLRTIDGDTIEVNIRGINKLLGKKIKIRLTGINTPEVRGKEKVFGLAVKRFVSTKFEKINRIHILNCSRGTFFRLVCEICIDKTNLNKLLIDKHLAKYYKDKPYKFAECK